MLNTKKLLYILPDLTYLAELLPNKKEHEFSIQSFRQINGEFLDDNEFISNNIQKLFTKIDKEEYHLILPDFLFTNTIVNVKEESEPAATKYVKEKLLPDLNLSSETHEIEITVLTSFKGNSKVQISAIEKDLLTPVRDAAKQSKIKISAVSPLSWTIKSIVSLEPSITVLQIGTNLYSAQHYIGVDQTNGFPVDELSSIIETIKTLKGAEPSIQTIYLASSSLIEEKLKEDLGGTLPIQQLATYKEDDSKIPSYVKYIIESCMKTISIKDFPVPKFNLGKSTKAAVTEKSEEPTKTEAKEKEEKKKEVETKKPEEKETAPTDLPEPSKVPEVLPVTEEKESLEMPEKKVDETKKDKPEEKLSELEVKEEKKETPKVEDKKEEKEPEVNLSQFAGKEETTEDEAKTEDSKDSEDSEVKTETKAEEKSDEKNDIQKHDKIVSTKKVIKNSSGVNNMLKMVFITLAVFFITIAIGIGVGLGLLKMSDKTPKEEPSPVVVTETEATPEPTPTPTPEPEVNKEEISILVVNATTKAGYAGKIKALLIENDIPDVKAGNAEGEYEDGTNYVLMTKENNSLKTLLEEATELNLEFSSDVEVEDNDGSYDAVIVLAK